MIDDDFIVVGNGRNRLIARWHIVGRGHRIIAAGFVDLHRLAIEGGIGEVASGATKINKREIKLLRILVHARTAADNLLEFRHRAHGTVEHNEATGLGIHPGGQQP